MSSQKETPLKRIEKELPREARMFPIRRSKMR